MPHSLGGTDNLIRARRFRTRYCVPRGHPSPEQLRARLDAISATELASALEMALRAYFQDSTDTLWFIRRIELDVSLNAGWNSDRLARAWAGRIARTLVQTIERGGDDVEVVRFDNRAAHLAQFLQDAVNQDAWSRWYYSEFQGLKLLPESAVIRTIVCDYGDDGRSALLAIPPRHIDRVLNALSVSDARRILESWSSKSDSTPLSQIYEQCWDHLKKNLPKMMLGNDPRQILASVLDYTRDHGTIATSDVVTAIQSLFTLVTVLHHQPVRIPILRRILVQGDPAALYTIVGSGIAESLAPLCSAPAPWREELISSASTLARSMSGEELASDEPPVVRQTPHGGLFLLFPLLASFPIDDATRSWPSCGDSSAAAVVRLLILAKCLGGTSLGRLCMDPVARDLIGLDPRTEFRDVAAWYEARTADELRQLFRVTARWIRYEGLVHRRNGDGLTSSRQRANREYLQFTAPVAESLLARRTFGLAAQGILRSFARKLPGFAESSFTHIRNNFLDVHATIIEEESRRVIQLGRPALDLILNMTGLSRATYRIPWLDARPVSLFPEGAV